MRLTRLLALLAVALLATIVLAACGDDDDDQEGGQGAPAAEVVPGTPEGCADPLSRDCLAFPDPSRPRFEMEPAGFEPATSRLQTERSTN
jgi:hypothetical protein